MKLQLPVPGSKSMTQRALILGALADGPVEIRGALDCDDSRHLSEILRDLGAQVTWNRSGPSGLAEREGEPRLDRVEVQGGRLQGSEKVLWCGNAGTALRFGACLALVADGALTFDGDARMRERPVQGLGDALETLGVGVEYLGKAGFPPVRLRRKAETPAAVTVESTVSSQFASGLLLVAPRLDEGLIVRLEGDVVSRSYIDMTLWMLEMAGVEATFEGQRTVTVPAGPLRVSSIRIEPDWSSAAFVLAAGGLAGCEIEVPGLVPAGVSIQGDSAFVELQESLARRGPRDLDLAATPDLIAPVAALAVFADGETRIRGVAHTRAKESDRIAVLARELGKLGVRTSESADGLDIEPLDTIPTRPIELDPANDHRMAMAFGVLSLRIPGIRVLDQACVNKSFPGFWEMLDRVKSTQVALRQAQGERLEPIGRHRISETACLGGPVLVGLRGVGKTSVAPLVAELLGMEWIDADAELERREGRSISEIFETEGEAGFRKRELDLELEILERPGAVIATGGGAVLHEEVRKRLADRMTVWLHAPVRVLARRIAGSNRPRLTDRSPEEELEQQRTDREPFYRQVAAMEVDTAGLQPADIARSIAGFWSAARRRS